MIRDFEISLPLEDRSQEWYAKTARKYFENQNFWDKITKIVLLPDSGFKMTHSDTRYTWNKDQEGNPIKEAIVTNWMLVEIYTPKRSIQLSITNTWHILSILEFKK